MRIGVLGTGVVGRTLAAGLAERGHEVTIGTRDPARTMARAEPGPPIRDWLASRPEVTLATYDAAAASAEVVVNATPGEVSLGVLREVGADNLAGKVLIDVANPLHASGGRLTLFVKDTDSLAEQIQRAFPDAKVVKTLNTVNASVMVDPQRVGGGDHTVFLSGNDADAKSLVEGVLREFGWTDVLDLGEIGTARGAEMWLPLWIRVMSALGTPAFNLKIVR